MSEVTNKHFDRRTVDRYVDKEIISREDFKNHMKSLPDETDNATWVQMDLHDTELGEGDSGDHDDEEDEA